jgi:CheY-like chemotaxis protein
LSKLLANLRILVLEDEFLIAMDVEDLCREHGAAEVSIIRSLSEIDADSSMQFDAAIVDLMLDGASTLDFAERLSARGVPFVFASGYTDVAEIRRRFPDIVLVGKPYSGDDLVRALASAVGRRAA